MENKDYTPLIGEKRSEALSPFAVFEYYKQWAGIRSSKLIPEGFYFLVGISVDKKKVDICPRLFVQGFQPHSQSGPFHSFQRGYGKIFVGTDQTSDLTSDDVVLQEANLYQAKPNDKFELVMFCNEWHDPATVEAFMQRFQAELKLESMSGIQKYKYTCPESSGYFLAGRKYKVWAKLVGENKNSQKLGKKVLIVDYHTGLPSVVGFDEKAFVPCE